MEWWRCGKLCHISATTRTHPPVPPCPPGARRGFCLQGPGPCSERDLRLVTASIGTTKPTHTMPVLRQRQGLWGCHVSSVPAPVAKGDILGPHLWVLQDASHGTLALTGPAMPLPPVPRSLSPVLRAGCHPSPTGCAQIAAERPQNVSSRPSCPHPRWPTAPHSSRCPSHDQRWPQPLQPPPRAVDPRELLALIQDGRRDSRIGWSARAAMLSEAGAAAASRHARRAAGCPEEGAGRLLTTWRPLAPPREEEAEGEEAAGGGRSLIHKEPGLLPSPPPSPSSPLPSGRPRPLPGTMSFFRRKGRGAAGGRPGAEGRPPPSSPARLLGPGPAPPGTASGPREEARPLRSELPANDGQSRHFPAPAAGPFSSLRGRGRGRGGGKAVRGRPLRDLGLSAAVCRPVGAVAVTPGSPVLPGAARGAAPAAFARLLRWGSGA